MRRATLCAMSCALLALTCASTLAQAQSATPAAAPTATRQAQPMSADPALEVRVMKVAEELRAAGLSVLMHAAGKDSWGSVKSQFKKADVSGARHALIFGADELARGEVALKPLREGAGGRVAAQSTRELRNVAAWATELRNA